MARTYDQIYGSLGSIYDPQTELVKKMQAALPGQQQAQQQGLDAAKTQAFGDIEKSANRKGMLFSGFSPDQQGKYLGTQYMPAMANMQNDFQQRQFSLEDSINKINAGRINDTRDIQGAESKAEEQAMKNAQDLYFRNANLDLAYARLGNSQANTQYSQQQKQMQMQQQAMNQYAVKQKKDNQGYLFTGAQGRPVSMRQFVEGTGGGLDVMLDLLRNSASKFDQQAYAQATKNIPIYLNDTGKANAILTNLKKLDTKNYYGLR